jgi:microcompartment protein CcmK/EutM
MYDLLADDVVGAGADNLVVVERGGMTKVKVGGCTS